MASGEVMFVFGNEVTDAQIDAMLDAMKAERARGNRTVVHVLETGKSYEVHDA